MVGHPLRVVSGGLLLWLTGMIVGIVVFSLPHLKGVPPVPFISSNPLITLPIWVIWAFLSRRLARPLVRRAADPSGEGLRVGLGFAAVNALLDLVVVAGLMKNGMAFYSYLGPWLAYVILIIVPWMTGRTLMTPVSSRPLP